MAMVENDDYEQSTSTMHYCKVCGRGFACGEALGGHMRAHGLVDARNYEDPPFEDKIIDGNNKHSYFLRTTANRFLSCKAREACDKMSLTWPDHNENDEKCTTNEMVSPISWMAPLKYGDNDESCASSQEEEELANCLVMLSSTPFVFPSNKEEETKVVGKGGFQCKGCKKVFNSHQALGGHRASHKNVKGCFASSFDYLNNDEEGMSMNTNTNTNTNGEFLSHNSNNYYHYSEAAWGKKDGPVFEAARRAPWDLHSKRKEKLHECSICFRVFSSGQALGGHKRCHWLSSNLPEKQVDQETKLVFKKPMIRKPEDVDLSFSLMSNNFSHDYEADSRACVPTRPKEGGEAMADFRNEEECRKKKIEKLSDLRNMDLDGESSSWLQVGIASTT